MIEVPYSSLQNKEFEPLHLVDGEYPPYMVLTPQDKSYLVLMIHIGGAATGVYTLHQAQDRKGRVYSENQGFGRLEKLDTLDALIEELECFKQTLSQAA
jgi:hypothetical protein